ncbi:hypothetical protein MIR68_000573 [Amoeboaphelidium protococcarum]|nr:hypothetical protein MIR68_000573 [Amoeboaphelidium protococcarum]
MRTFVFSLVICIIASVSCLKIAEYPRDVMANSDAILKICSMNRFINPDKYNFVIETDDKQAQMATPQIVSYVKIRMDGQNFWRSVFKSCFIVKMKMPAAPGQYHYYVLEKELSGFFRKSFEVLAKSKSFNVRTLSEFQTVGGIAVQPDGNNGAADGSNAPPNQQTQQLDGEKAEEPKGAFARFKERFSKHKQEKQQQSQQQAGGDVKSNTDATTVQPQPAPIVNNAAPENGKTADQSASNVQPQQPSNSQDASTSSKISGFFKW